MLEQSPSGRLEVIHGTQEYDILREPFLHRFADAFGSDAAAEIAEG